ncbi:OLC1v1033752C1 [Oldenlandia corymbosa var. corymbosa]|uniref:OLC1v1033752C1 n=1 Tax=Oldenlandia corymbosa var. corymbosa TaxID=529605 RepID=A0AAV1CRV4_OLDCO|nr:OLC1v1033752C1 [Oldenlandia corymbosa var. corymbosa]
MIMKTAEYAKLPVVIPPYLEPNADYDYGVNFASGGAGILSSTNQGLVIDLKTQLEYFDKVRLSWIEKFGEAETENIISDAVYFISMGSNDYMGGYLGNPKMQHLHPPEEFVKMVIGNLSQGIQELYGRGARKFAFLSLCPLGCLPALRALNPKGHEAGCFEDASALASAHNNALKMGLLPDLQALLKGFKYSNPNFYDWLLDKINHPTDHGKRTNHPSTCFL